MDLNVLDHKWANMHTDVLHMNYILQCNKTSMQKKEIKTLGRIVDPIP